ncbi:MAG: hypothetical protein HY594_04535 [Candidatus Omnitrophica bacterium]|nr:hypothetical protein [Candidatus Omnitrophota bacterium]
MLTPQPLIVNRIKNENGIALPLALVLGMLVTLSVLVALNATGHRLRMTALNQHRGTLFYADEAAVQAAFIKLGRDLPVGAPPGTKPSAMVVGVPAAETMTIGTRTVTLTVTKTQASPLQYKVEAKSDI